MTVILKFPNTFTRILSAEYLSWNTFYALTCLHECHVKHLPLQYIESTQANLPTNSAAFVRTKISSLSLVSSSGCELENWELDVEYFKLNCAL